MARVHGTMRRDRTARSTAACRALAERAAGVARFIPKINLGLIAAFPVPGAAAMNSVREHDRPPAAREAPSASPPGAPGG